MALIITRPSLVLTYLLPSMGAKLQRGCGVKDLSFRGKVLGFGDYGLRF